jgi:hypothetical protein
MSKAVPVLRWLVLVAAVSCVPVPAHAQKVLIGQAGTALYDLATGRVEWSLPARLGTPGAVFTPDGRLAVSFTGQGITVFDIPGGTSFDLPLSFQPAIAHPRAMAMYGLTGGPLGFGFMTQGTLARLDAGGLTTYGGCAPGTTTRVDLSGDGRLLFAGCEDGTLAVLDAASGAQLRSVPLEPLATFKANFDGTALVVSRPTFMGAVDVIDATTGAVQASTVVPGGGCNPGIAQASPDRTTVVVTCLGMPVPTPSWSTHALTLPGLTWGPPLAGINLNVASISPDNARSFSTYRHRTGVFGRVQINDLASGAMTLEAPIIATIAVAHAPLAPTVSATVTGRRVDLAWTLPAASPAATGYILEIGTAPGLVDLGTVALGSEPALSVPSVPPGRYYVRIRAGNAVGRSVASADVVVEVTP